MEISFLFLLVPLLLLPFVRMKWSLFLSYGIYGSLGVFSLINIWLHLTNWSHMSEGLAFVFGALAAVCIALMSLTRYLYVKSLKRSSSSLARPE